MKGYKNRGLEAWQQGLLVGLLGMAMVLLAAKWKEIPAASEMQRMESQAEETESPGNGYVETGAAGSESEGKKIALTFDDGPHPYYTEKLLDGLAERKVKASFFLLGENLEGREEIVRRMAREGHLIGNHTYYHVDITRLEPEEACREITGTAEKIEAIIGNSTEYIRPPFGNWNRELECAVEMIPIFWTLDTLDWSTKNADRIVQKVVTEAEENDIILMHDSYASTVEAALRIVDLLSAQGYEFVTADELILE